MPNVVYKEHLKSMKVIQVTIFRSFYVFVVCSGVYIYMHCVSVAPMKAKENQWTYLE